MRLARTLLLFAPLLAVLTGCTRDEPIQVDTITYEDREPIRLRVAIMKHDKLVWFFRLSGPEAAVKEHVKEFDAFVRSVRFEVKKDGPPITLTEPKTWKKDPPSKMRYAGYRLGAKPKELEVTIVRLEGDEYSLVKNVHRWQRQINVPLVESEAEARALVVRDETAAGQHLIEWIDLTGLGVHTVSKPPEPLAVNPKKKFALGGPKQPRGGPGMPFEFTAPKDWAKKGPGAMAAETFEVTDGKSSAQVTLTKLPVGGGTVAENINRWREQVALPKLPDDEILPTLQKLVIPGMQSAYVDLANKNGPPGRNRILGVIIPLPDGVWFVKMTGPIDLVGQHKDAFETFVRSFKLDGR